MALRYRVERAQEGMVIEPLVWNANMNELAGEFNGSLSGDNIPATVLSSSQVAARAFTKTSTNIQSSSFTVSSSTIDWQDTDASAVVVGGVSINPPTDCTVDVEFYGSHQWTSTGTSTAPFGNYIFYQVIIDGTVVCESGPITDTDTWNQVNLAGTMAVQAGPHTITVRVKVAEINTSFLPSDGGYNLFATVGPCLNTATLKERVLLVLERYR